VTTALIETVRVLNGATPLWNHHLARVARGAAALGMSFPTLVPPHGGPDRIVRYEIGREGVRVRERDVEPTRPVRLITARTRHQPYPHKLIDRICFDQAGREATSAGKDEAVLLTAQGWVAEATIWSLCWWEMGLLCGPALDLGILPGVGRARLAELSRAMVERKVTRRALAGVPVFLVNAGRGVMEVESWDGERVPRHPETERLAREFWP